MNVCKNEIRDAVEAELIAANEKHPPFTSLHEAYAVILEEFEEAKHELIACDKLIQEIWTCTKMDKIKVALAYFARLRYNAERLAMEACQMAAMAIKAEQSFADKMGSENENENER